MKPFYLLLLCCLSLAARSYDSFSGFSAGISFAFGNKVNRIGIAISGYYTYAFVQVNASARIYYNFQSLGLKLKTPEIQLASGAEFGFGKKDSVRNNFIGPTENNLLFKNAIGYSYIRYWDRNGTSQSTGILDLHAGPFKIATENDLFAAGQGWRDRFRTGAFLVEYQYGNTKFAINSTLWTGDYTGCDNVYDSEYPARFGYRTCEKGLYCDYSLGLLSLEVRQLLPLPFGQVAQANIGIDSERVRNAIQNKLVHDQPFFPKKWIKRQPAHLPMVTPNGNQYLFAGQDSIRPATFYFNVALNNGVFY